ncbi:MULTISPECIES: RecQ family ATP-dependent DNA helicase [Bacillus]|uniref:RecQ family ATP-dependent DNA helicase n=1 Tax=Bacillus TaxID=1386 RepID=UPI0011ED8AD6|nr:MULTISPECIES: ATP-dependent DNA helicase RecQ [Bacillus]KAA0836334.1 ATP-dependent DNA helicase RecQ [Bacillus paralicheniformis]KAA0843432.1 ATP-dependent DNA helicase RecQ [Bacillus paralicheniformis]MCB6216680.1 ATP-dependent DNA helicase [Bacillus paralicheniformis]MCY1629591.1 ATP-dependent DNA helicase [Bacillus paralicheniformis]MEC4202254.1 ATP-dependent DNA helicase RecQ [Bacillus sp. AAVF1]
MDKLHQALRRYFGYHTFKNGQEKIIKSVLEGRDTVAMLPTGGGKSLCYQLPGLLKDGTVLIVSPLLSLMEDQVQQLKMRGEKRAAALNSALTHQEKNDVLSRLHSLKYLYISPEALQSGQVLKKLQLLNVSLFVVDEAHCISQWGHDFRPDYSKLGDIKALLGHPVTLALTATATEATLKDISNMLGLKGANYLIHSVDRPNIALHIEKLRDTAEKTERLTGLVQKLQGPGLVYCPTRKWAEELADKLRDETKLRTGFYHGGMEASDRMLIQQQFIRNQLDVVCCTNAFGMGVDKPDVRYVIHFSLPQTTEAYLQEIGRAGRDGKQSVSILLKAPGDEEIQEQLIQMEALSQSDIGFLYEKLAGVKDERNRREVLQQAGLSETQARHFLHLYQKVHHLGDDGRAVIQREMDSRRELKLKKAAGFAAVTESEGCFRESLLAYFNEQKEPLETDDTACCTSCGLSLEAYEAKGDRPSMNKLTAWEEELDAIFAASCDRVC